MNIKLEPSTTQRSKTKAPEIDITSFEPQIISEHNKILIVNGHCSIIREFSLSSNFSFDCLLKHLPIDFILKHHTGSDTLLTAFIDRDNELLTRQDVSNICRKIRRYEIRTYFELSELFL